MGLKEVDRCFLGDEVSKVPCASACIVRKHALKRDLQVNLRLIPTVTLKRHGNQ
jgi:hypothetical protein